jgi:alpha,alpha-trehalose phosphorylase
LAGAAFPWRTITGAECSGYWPAGAAAFHVGADIADAVVRYVEVTGDERFEREVGLELLVETARLWRSLGHHDAQGRFRIDGVTGPDEYSAVADNNIYTNLMAQHNLASAADVAERHPTRLISSASMTGDGRLADAAKTMCIPYDDVLGVHPQAEGFTSHEVWDFAATSADQYPLLLHFPYFDLYRKQVVKQADLVLAMHLRGEAFTDEEKVATSPTTRPHRAGLIAVGLHPGGDRRRSGAPRLAYDYLAEAALMDLDDLEHNTRDGLHLAALAGTWIALWRDSPVCVSGEVLAPWASRPACPCRE